MSTSLRQEWVAVLPTASAPAAAAWWNGRLAVGASDLQSQSAALWLVGGGDASDPEPLPLAHVDGLTTMTEHLIVTGWSPAGERRMMVGVAPGSITAVVELPVQGDIAREPRPIVFSGRVLVVWEEYAGTGVRTVVQAVEPEPSRGWRLEGDAIRSSPRSFAVSIDVVSSGDALVQARVDEAGVATIERLDARLGVHASAALQGRSARIAVAAADGRFVVASVSREGGPVTVHSLDDRLIEIASPVILPPGDERARVTALTVATPGDVPLALIAVVNTVLGDPETVGIGSEATLGPAPRRTTEWCRVVDLETASVSNPYGPDPPNRGPAAIVWRLNRVHIVHGSSPLYVTELSVTRV